MMIAILITSSAMNGVGNPASHTDCSGRYSSGWTDNRQVCKWGLVFRLVQVVLCVVVGIPGCKPAVRLTRRMTPIQREIFIPSNIRRTGPHGRPADMFL